MARGRFFCERVASGSMLTTFRTPLAHYGKESYAKIADDRAPVHPAKPLPLANPFLANFPFITYRSDISALARARPR